MDTLKMVLDNLMKHNPLLTWQMYQEKSGSVMLKLRFGDIGENQQDPNTKAHFKRKSDTQMQRDIKRASEHKQRTGVTTRGTDSRSPSNHANNDEQNLNDSIETFRNFDLANQSPAGMSPASIVECPTMDYSTSSIVTAQSPPEIHTAGYEQSETTTVIHTDCNRNTNIDFILPDVYQKAKFLEHLELERITPSEYKDIVCHACNCDLHTLADKFGDQAGLTYCHNCYFYICKHCKSHYRHTSVCNFPLFVDIT